MGAHNLAQVINKQSEVVIKPEADRDDGETIVRGED